MFASKAQQSNQTPLPDVKPYENKKVMVRLEGNRRVTGVLGGYDQFMNLTIRNAVETDNTQQQQQPLGTTVIRGSSVLNIEAIE